MDGLQQAIFRARCVKSEAPDNTIANIQQRLAQIEATLHALVNNAKSEVPKPQRLGRRPTIEEIKLAVCRKYKITLIEIEGAIRAKALVEPRQLAMYLATKHTIHSLPGIAKYFGDRDHTTVLHARNKIAAKMAKNKTLDTEIKELEAELRLA